jgi:hypothetical protein
MISIEKLMQNLTQCKDTNILLPSMNDDENNKFIQKTAIDIRKEELELLDTVITQLNEANYTMDNEIKDLQSNNRLQPNIDTRINRENQNDNLGVVPSKSLIVYTENETAPLPEIILNLFNLAGLSVDDWYIYGVKNPESIYKSFMLLTKMDFIIKNKNEKKNEVATFKREMAIQYETFYKTLEYRKLRFPHFEMVHKLTDIDNYAEYDAIKYMVDYSMTNIIILDIVNEKYLDIKYTNHNLHQNINYTNSNEYVIIIKYANNTYLPLMNSNIGHKFNSSILEIINKHFERIVIEKYKELNTINNSNENPIEIPIEIPIIDNIIEYGIEDAILEDNIITNPLEFNEPGDILNCDTVSVFYNNIISSKIDEIKNYEPIIKTGTLTFAIEDMIDIEEQEDTLSNTTQPKLEIIQQQINNNNTKNNNNTNNFQEKNIKKIVINEPIQPSILVNHLDSQSSQSIDAFTDLMNKIPMKGKTKVIINSKEKELNPKNNLTTLETLLNTVSTSSIANTKSIIINSNNNNNKEELKPIGKYNLLELQMLAKLYKIDTRKQGSAGKMINKTKQEIYDEIQKKI